MHVSVQRPLIVCGNLKKFPTISVKVQMKSPQGAEASQKQGCAATVGQSSREVHIRLQRGGLARLRVNTQAELGPEQRLARMARSGQMAKHLVCV